MIHHTNTHTAQRGRRKKRKEREGKEERERMENEVVVANKVGGGANGEEGGGSRSMRTADMVLRLAAVGLCVAAMVVMLSNSQTTELGSVSYSHLTAFRYLVHANGICAGYSLLSALVAVIPRPSTLSRAWTFFLLDQVLTYIVLAAGAVSTEVLYLAYEGDTKVTWSEVCGSFSGFCHRATISVVITFVAVACYAALSLVSSYRLFTKFDAPQVAGPDRKSIEVATFNS